MQIESRQTHTVFLPEEVAVLLFYWTVLVDKIGVINSKKDVYERDKAVLEELDGQFKLKNRPFANQ